MNETERIANAYFRARDQLLNERVGEGHWIGQLSTSALSTATAVSALSAIQTAAGHRDHADLIERGIAWLASHQNGDGGWGDTPKSYSNISTTLLTIACFHFANRQHELADSILRAEQYVDSQGGIPGLRRRYGKDKTFAVPILANAAMAGIVDWKEVATLPFEAGCVPQKFYHLMQLPVVSYAIPALVAIGQAKFLNDPPWNPLTRWIRRWSIGRSLRVLEKMQPASGGYLEAIPLTSFVVMGLATTERHQHPVVQSGLKFIQRSVLKDGSWPIDTNLATWTTTLSVNALAARFVEQGESVEASESGRLPQSTIEDPSTAPEATVFSNESCLRWILQCQNRSVHPFTNSPPGGWGWTDLSGAVPDADDTPGALLALDKFYRWGGFSDSLRTEIRQAASLGVGWLLDLQNRDLGWPTFCRGWGKLPFDRSGSDITAHCLRGIHAWKSRVDMPAERIERAIRGGLTYLEKQQQADGSWLPLWFGNQDERDEENPVYGTAKVLAAYFELGLIETPVARRGWKWLVANQNPDGSFGGGPSCAKSFGKYRLGKLGGSPDGSDERIGSIEETALALDALLLAPESDQGQRSIEKATRWLVDAVEADCHRIDSPIGFYFAKLWYHERLYPQVFAVAALGRALSRSTARVGG